MPWSALPTHLNRKINPDAWKNTDNDVWYLRWKIWIKPWIAFGPRATEWWAKWREIPKVLFARKGFGPWRYEYTDGTPPDLISELSPEKFLVNGSLYYLSTLQLHTRWSFIIQWPFHISFHYYYSPTMVAKYPEKSNPFMEGNMFFFRFGCRRDADKVYWLGSLFVGQNWN